MHTTARGHRHGWQRPLGQASVHAPRHGPQSGCRCLGEGGSGGALAIGVGDQVNMLQYSTYSVISPEGCASILWKSAEKAPLAADAMGITAARIKELGLIDEVIAEPLGGAHRAHEQMAASLKQALIRDLAKLDKLSVPELLDRRYKRLMSFGYC